MTDDFQLAWTNALGDILLNGSPISPRGQHTRELLQKTIKVDMRKPVLTIPQRKLSYKFMAAEAYWILSGDDQVRTIEPYNKYISQFSDDGEVFFGAYGPKIASQIGYVVDKLQSDPNTRQAGLTTWRECPPETKDVPCTISIFFNIRGGMLNCHVFMRSSDIWLGVPYDVFNFSMLSHMVCGLLAPTLGQVSPGTLYLTAASSHLYARDFEKAEECICAPAPPEQARTPEILFADVPRLMEWLRDLRDTTPGSSFLRWWEFAEEKPDWED